MICPSCGTHIPDESRICPACRTLVGQSTPSSVDAVSHGQQPVYCKACGAIVPKDKTFCPSCGLHIEAEHKTETVNIKRSHDIEARLADPSHTETGDAAVEQRSSSLDDTQAIPRLNTALPDEPTEGEKSAFRMPRTRAIVLAALAALLVVGGITLAITHPWDPDAYSTSATTPADTSQAGFPGTLDSLSAQDTGITSSSNLSSEESSYLQFYEAWESLGALRDEIVANEELFEEIAYSGSDEDREAAAEEAELISIELSNLITSIGQIDTADGTYSDTQTALLSLGNWLRNYSDNICNAWDAALASSDPEGERSSIEAILNSGRNADGRNAYLVLFDANYESAEPEAP